MSGAGPVRRTARATPAGEPRGQVDAERPSAPRSLALWPSPPRERVRERQGVRRRLLLTFDVGAYAFAVALVLLFRRDVYAHGGLALLVVGLASLVLACKVLGLYESDPQRVLPSTLDEVPKLAVAAGISVAVATFVVAPRDMSLTRWDVLALWLLTLVLLPPARVAARSISRRVSPPERVAILGEDPMTEVLADSCRKRPRDVGIVDVPVDGVGPLEICARCLEYRVERVVLVSDAFDTDVALALLRELRNAAIAVSLVPRIAEETGAGLTVEHLDGVGLLGVPSIARPRSTMVLKRALDLSIAIPLVVATLPTMLLVSALIRLTSPGPAFFRQQRVGRNGEPFTMLKFRTMVDGAHEARADLAHLNTHEDGLLFKLDDDPRITRVGRVLRSTSLDELPQLLNVLLGDMSVVGPRPLIAEEDGHVVGWHRRRLDIAPGLTGPWQVLQEHRVPFGAMVKIDCLYVLEWSPWTDVKIILRTLPVVLRRSSR